VLTLTSAGVERDGLVERTVPAVVPPQVDYTLTPLGTPCSKPSGPLAAWTRQHHDEIADARTR